MDPEVVTAKQALDAAQTNLDNARMRYNDAAAKYDSSGGDPNSDSYDPVATKAASDIFQRASVALQQAETDYATAARQLSTAHGSAATRAGTPEGRAAYAAQAKSYEADAKLKEGEAAVLGAKSDADLKQAQASLLNAQQGAARTAAEIQTVLPAQANSLNAAANQSLAAAGEASARTSSLIPAQAAQAQAGAAAATAQAEQTQAQTTQLVPAQVKQAMAAAGLNDAQSAALWQKISQPQQITQGADQPNLAFQNQDGSVSAQRNPAYQAANTTLLQNRADTQAKIRSMLESGQMQPLEAQQYMDLFDQQTQAALQGTTPFAQFQQRQNYTRDAGGIGRDILNARVAQGSQLAGSLISGLNSGAGQINVPFDFKGVDPFAMAKGFVNDLGGGQQVGNSASAMVQALTGGLQQGAQGLVTGPDGLPHDPSIPIQQMQGQVPARA